MNGAIWQARLETRHFDFECYGETSEKAVSGLIEGLQKHAALFRLSRDWFLPFQEDIACRRIEPYVCYRDREAIR